jgi:hypothetical protein
MNNFKDYMTTGREKVLQKADIDGKNMGGPLGELLRQRAVAIFNRGVEPTRKNKLQADDLRNKQRFWKKLFNSKTKQ